MTYNTIKILTRTHKIYYINLFTCWEPWNQLLHQKLSQIIYFFGQVNYFLWIFSNVRNYDYDKVYELDESNIY